MKRILISIFQLIKFALRLIIMLSVRPQPKITLQPYLAGILVEVPIGLLELQAPETVFALRKRNTGRIGIFPR